MLQQCTQQLLRIPISTTAAYVTSVYSKQYTFLTLFFFSNPTSVFSCPNFSSHFFLLIIIYFILMLHVSYIIIFTTAVTGLLPSHRISLHKIRLYTIFKLIKVGVTILHTHLLYSLHSSLLLAHHCCHPPMRLLSSRPLSDPSSYSYFFTVLSALPSRSCFGAAGTVNSVQTQSQSQTQFRIMLLEVSRC